MILNQNFQVQVEISSMKKRLKRNKERKKIQETDQIQSTAKMILILAVIESLKVIIHQEARAEKREDQIRDQEEDQKMITL